MLKNNTDTNKTYINIKLFLCAGKENRTPTSSLARTCPTTKRYPQNIINSKVLYIK